MVLDHLAWAAELKALIRKGLVLSIGSADAERGFSILKHTSLAADLLNALLLIRINMPNIEDFNVVKYSRLSESWIV